MSSNATGPRSDAGKERSAVNALKHGLCAQRAVIPGEDPAEWDAFRTEVVRSYAPADFLQRELAERVALQMWRQRRAARYEAALIAAVATEEAAEGDSDAAPAQRLMEALDRVVRYESHIGRQLKEALKLLSECQARPPVPPSRATAPAPPPRAPSPVPTAGAEPSSFRQLDAAPRPSCRVAPSLPLAGVSFADFALVPQSPAATT